MRIYIIAGEASGDLHGSNLVAEIKKRDPNVSFRGWGGDLMQAQGVEVTKHYRELAIMGFVEVVKKLGTIMKNFKACKQDITEFNPDAVILIDYPGFNLRMAEFIKNLGPKVIYYISPQVWAWKQSRVKKIRQFVDQMLVILPFEKAWYAERNVDVTFVGHPLLDAINKMQDDSDATSFRQKHALNDKPIVALLPGSRKQEISRMLPLMVSVRNDFPDHQFVIAGVSNQDASTYAQAAGDVKIVKGDTYGLLKESHAALVTSGTATLETALFRVPQVVCYKGGGISYQIAKRLIKVAYISLVNLIMDAPVVKELIQNELSPKNIKQELSVLINETSEREEQLSKYQLLSEKLGGPGASANAAEEVLKTLHG